MHLFAGEKGRNMAEGEGFEPPVLIETTSLVGQEYHPSLYFRAMRAIIQSDIRSIRRGCGNRACEGYGALSDENRSMCKASRFEKRLTATVAHTPHMPLVRGFFLLPDALRLKDMEAHVRPLQKTRRWLPMVTAEPSTSRFGSGKGGRMGRNKKERALAFIDNPHDWPLYPILPMKRKIRGEEDPELGVLVWPEITTIVISSMFELPQTRKELAKLPQEVFGSVDSMLWSGWEVD
jgi:hypothetical protein